VFSCAALSSASFHFLLGSESGVIFSMVFLSLWGTFRFASSAFGGYFLYGFVCLWVRLFRLEVTV
jgi:hypothetical protein